MNNDNNWDLHAVVRGCCSSTRRANTADLETLSCLNYFFNNKDESFLEEGPFEELHGACKPFLAKYNNQTEPLQNSLILEKENQPQIVEEKRKFSQLVFLTNTTAHGRASTHIQPPRSKRRKNQLKKKVCHVSEDALSSDIWAWRKYGQKPIKGSPYPRGYYRCSSSKGCPARKQVERNRSDPTMFIVTYTSEHNHPAPTHRNSLAGSTRQKPNATEVAASAAATENRGESCSSSGNSGGSFDDEELVMNANSSVLEDTIDDGDELADVSDMSMSDDFFDGLDDFITPAAGDYFSELFSGNFGMNWTAHGAAAATAAGGC